MKYLCLFTLLVAYFSTGLRAQTISPFYKEPQLYPASPEAAGILKVSDVAVDCSSGTGNLDLPIYTIRDGGITVPISISYNTGGIKVQDIAGLIGLGWNLNTGGGIQVNQEICEPDLTVAGSRIKQDADIDVDYVASLSFCSEVNSGLHEKQTPQYNYHFGSYSGSFFYDINNVVHIKSDNPNILIQRLGTGFLSGFEITTDEGIIYDFNNAETVSGQSGWQAVTALFLSRIFDPNTNRTVRFTYKAEPFYGQPRETQTLYYLTQPSNVLPGCSGLSEEAESNTLSVNTLAALQIDSIIFSSGYVKFNSASDRLDPNPVRIISVGVFNKTGASIKTVNFYQSYFVSAGGYTTKDNYRLRLDSMATVSASTPEKTDNYSFLYNLATGPAYRRSDMHLCTGVDFWGYYNGQDGNPTMLPIELITAADLNSYSLYSLVGHRAADSTHNQVFSLQKVIYPTGGCVQFVYESNQVPGYYLGTVVGGLRIKYINYYDHFNAPRPLRQQYFQYISGTIPTYTLNDYVYDKIKTNTCYSAQEGQQVIENYTRNVMSDPIGMNAYLRINPFYLQVESDVMDGPVAKEKTVYYFDNTDQLYHQGFGDPDYGFVYFSDRSWLKGNLLKKTEQYKWIGGSTYSLVHKEENFYTDYSESQFQTGLLVYTPNHGDYMGGDMISNNLTSTYEVAVNAYGFLNTINTTGLRRLSSAVKTDYAGTDSLVTTTSFTYNSYNYPEMITENNSKGQIVEDYFDYTSDLSLLGGLSPAETVIVDTMLGRNMLKTVLKHLTFTAGNSTRSEIRHYNSWSEPSGNIIGLQSVDEAQLGNAPETREVVYAYDNYGNVTERSKINDVHEVYLWGYNGQYPVANVLGSDYPTVNGLVNQTILQNPTSDNQLATELNKIRTGLATSRVLATTYTFSPMVGETSVTDPAGKTSYYGYDFFNRLAWIKDLNSNIVKTFNYQYASPAALATKYYNAPLSATITRSNCTGTQIPGQYTYVVPAAKYSSSTSQFDADNQAVNDVSANGHNTANTQAACIVPTAVNFSYVNSTTATYILQFKDGTGNIVTSLVLSPTTGNLPVVAGQVLTGSYNVYLFSPSSPSPRNLILGNIEQNAVYSISAPYAVKSFVDASAYIYN